MKQIPFGNLSTGDIFSLSQDGQDYEKIALKDIREVFPWSGLRSLTNCREFPIVLGYGNDSSTIGPFDQEVTVFTHPRTRNATAR